MQPKLIHSYFQNDVLVSRLNHFYNYNFQVAVICKAEEGGDAVSIVD